MFSEPHHEMAPKRMPRSPATVGAVAFAVAGTLAACGGGEEASSGSRAAEASGADTVAMDTVATPAGVPAGAVTADTAADPDTTAGAARSEPGAETSPQPVPVQDAGPAFLSPVEVLNTARPRVRPRVLETVRTGAHAGFDRVVFEFRGDTLPGYYAAYVDGPVIACGSGDEVELEGETALMVRMDPAQAHVDYEPTITERRRAPRLDALQELVVTCDFEGQVAWALGLNGRVPFRAFALTEPTRLVVDVRHVP